MTSPRFEGKSRVERHRLVYDALADLMQREIHALAMILLAPGETERRAGGSNPDHPSGH
jgi:BolA protein